MLRRCAPRQLLLRRRYARRRCAVSAALPREYRNVYGNAVCMSIMPPALASWRAHAPRHAAAAPSRQPGSRCLPCRFHHAADAARIQPPRRRTRKDKKPRSARQEPHTACCTVKARCLHQPRQACHLSRAACPRPGARCSSAARGARGGVCQACALCAYRKGARARYRVGLRRHVLLAREVTSSCFVAMFVISIWYQPTRAGVDLPRICAGDVCRHCAVRKD